VARPVACLLLISFGSSALRTNRIKSFKDHACCLLRLIFLVNLLFSARVTPLPPYPCQSPSYSWVGAWRALRHRLDLKLASRSSVKGEVQCIWPAGQLFVGLTRKLARAYIGPWMEESFPVCSTWTKKTVDYCVLIFELCYALCWLQIL
jgi:hypothetical protein